MLRKGSPTPAGHRGSSSGQPILGTQSATTTTHMVLSKFYLLRYCFKLRLENKDQPPTNQFYNAINNTNTYK